MTKKPWFHGKKHGYGWGLPAGKEGWLMFILYIVLVLFELMQLMSLSNSGRAGILIMQILLTSILFLGICFATGEDKSIRGKK